MQAAARVVAGRHRLPDNWLNDRAAAFRPSTLRDDDCSVLLDHPNLLVLGAPLRQVFHMKLYAYREPDRDDLVRIGKHCGFGSVDEAVEEFYEAYPRLDRDPFLGELVERLLHLADAGRTNT